MALPPHLMRVDRARPESETSSLWIWLTAGSLTAPLVLFFVGRWYLTQSASPDLQPKTTEIEAASPKSSSQAASRSPKVTALKESDLKKLVNSGVVPFSIRQPEFTAPESIAALRNIETSDDRVLDREATLQFLAKFLVTQSKAAVQSVPVQSQQISVQATGRVFLFVNPSSAVSKTVQSALIRGQNLAADVLRSRGFTVIEVPTGSATQAILWINQQAKSGDVALSIQADAFFNPDVRGASAFYIAGNQERRVQAERLLRQVQEAIPELQIRGAQPDSETALGKLTFTRQAKIPAIVLTVGFATNPEERSLILNQIQDLAQGIANGLETWSLAIAQPVDRVVPSINLRVNDQLCNPPGILVNGNAYIPSEALELLNVQPPATARRIRTRNTTYFRVIDLQSLGIVTNWNPKTRTLAFRPAPVIKPKITGSIMGKGILSRKQLEAVLKAENPQALQRFPEIAKLYLEEAAIEGVNSDVAFAQALLETNFLRFDRGSAASQNNFGGLRAVAESVAATFPSVRLGVRAHIQQLKAYANQEALVKPLVSLRFRFVDRGSATKVEALSDRWSADPNYGDRVLTVLARLYRSRLS